MLCLTGARFTMNAEVLHQELVDEDADSSVGGTWVNKQDPLSGSIERVWKPAPPVPGKPGKPATTKTIDCLVRGIVDGGIRVAGSTERFGDTYENIDYVKMWIPARVKVTKSDRITNIRNKRGGDVIWLDEEYDNGPTIFNVNGVTPLFDAFNRHVENFVLLEKA